MEVVLNRTSPWICIIWWHCWWAHGGLCQLQKGEALLSWQGAKGTYKSSYRKIHSRYVWTNLLFFIVCVEKLWHIEFFSYLQKDFSPWWSPGQILSLFTLRQLSDVLSPESLPDNQKALICAFLSLLTDSIHVCSLLTVPVILQTWPVPRQ